MIHHKALTEEQVARVLRILPFGETPLLAYIRQIIGSEFTDWEFDLPSRDLAYSLDGESTVLASGEAQPVEEGGAE